MKLPKGEFRGNLSEFHSMIPTTHLQNVHLQKGVRRPDGPKTTMAYIANAAISEKRSERAQMSFRSHVNDWSLVND